MKKLIVSILAVLVMAGCSPDAQVASRNLSQAADMFEIMRRVIFYDAIQGKYLLVIEGLCSIHADRADGQLEVTCKTGPAEFKKHFLGISDNVTYFVEQVDGSKQSVYHYRVIFKPDVIVPNIDFVTGVGK